MLGPQNSESEHQFLQCSISCYRQKPKAQRRGVPCPGTHSLLVGDRPRPLEKQGTGCQGPWGGRPRGDGRIVGRDGLT